MFCALQFVLIVYVAFLSHRPLRKFLVFNHELLKYLLLVFNPISLKHFQMSLHTRGICPTVTLYWNYCLYQNYYRNTWRYYWILLRNYSSAVTENQSNQRSGLHAPLLELFILQLKWTKLYSNQFLAMTQSPNSV